MDVFGARAMMTTDSKVHRFLVAVIYLIFCGHLCRSGRKRPASFKTQISVRTEVTWKDSRSDKARLRQVKVQRKDRRDPLCA